MSLGSPAAADVPGLYDLIINGRGYIFDRALDQSLPFRVQRARYGRSPTFLDRTNVSGDYGDDKQAFWQTATQRDWSLGEDQVFFDSTNSESVSRYWGGDGLDISIPGQVSMDYARTALTFAANPTAMGWDTTLGSIFFTTSTNLYAIGVSGAISSLGAHGCGASPTTVASDGVRVFMCGVGATAVRVWDGVSVTSFSTTPASSLAFLNNSMYGMNGNTLYKYDSTGTATVAAQLKLSDGTGWTNGGTQICAWGGQLAVLQTQYNPNGHQMWTYNGTGLSLQAQLPTGFVATGMCVVSGILFICGQERKVSNLTRPAIYYVTASGSIGRAWAAPFYSSNSGFVGMSPFQEGILFNDYSTTVAGGSQYSIRYYDLAEGGVHTVSQGGSTSQGLICGADSFAVAANTATTAALFLYSTAPPSTATLYTSLYDFDSSLTKLFRGVTLKFSAPQGTLDVYYRLDDLNGAYTLLQSGVTSGTEVAFPANTTGQGVSLKIVFNRGASQGPTLKRIYVRAVPVLQSYRECEYVLDLSGRNGKTPVMLNNDESYHPLTGVQMATNLNNDIKALTPVSITDRFGTFTGIIQPDQSDIIEVRPEEYIARVLVREV